MFKFKFWLLNMMSFFFPMIEVCIYLFFTEVNTEKSELKAFFETNCSQIYFIFYENFITLENNLKQKGKSACCHLAPSYTRQCRECLNVQCRHQLSLFVPFFCCSCFGSLLVPYSTLSDLAFPVSFENGWDLERRFKAAFEPSELFVFEVRGVAHWV